MDNLNELVKNPYFIEIANNMTEYMYIVDSKGCVIFMNHSAQKFEDISLASVYNRHIDEIYTQDESPTLVALRSGKPIAEHENIYFRNGKEFR